MTPKRYKQINELLDAISKLKPIQQQAFLDQVCAADASLLREIEMMLAAEEQAEANGFLETPAPSKFAELLATDQISMNETNKPILLNGRYLIEQELGQGGFGTVYLARDLRIHSRPIVIKVLFEQSSTDEWLKKKFQQEIEALARIDHPGVVGILDAGDTPDGKPFLAMQYVRGHDLRSMLKPEGMDFEQAATIIRQVAHALSAAHDQGVLHCDLKPENIMLQDFGEGEYQVKIVDFGIAKIKDSQVQTGSQITKVAGTVYYMAPEHVRGKPSVASDVFSLAVIAYEMLTGCRPFNPTSPYQAVEAVLDGVSIKPRKLRKALSAESQKIILKALSFDARDRYERAKDFGESLAQSLTANASLLVPPQSAEDVSPEQNYISERSSKQDAPASSHDLCVPEIGVLRIPKKLWRNKKHVMMIASSLILVLAIVLFYMATHIPSHSPVDSGGHTSTPSMESERVLSYWLLVQKCLDENHCEQPFPMAADEPYVFNSNYRVKLNITMPPLGHFYVLNESFEKLNGKHSLYHSVSFDC